MSEKIGKSFFEKEKDKSKKIEKPLYWEKEEKLFVNASLYFCGVSQGVWEYKIGGYQVLDKYLKSHKNEELDEDYFQKIIQALHQSLVIEEEIRAVELD